jgi:hypothetical protein
MLFQDFFRKIRDLTTSGRASFETKVGHFTSTLCVPRSPKYGQIDQERTNAVRELQIALSRIPSAVQQSAADLVGAASRDEPKERVTALYFVFAEALGDFQRAFRADGVLQIFRMRMYMTPECLHPAAHDAAKIAATILSKRVPGRDRELIEEFFPRQLSSPCSPQEHNCLVAKVKEFLQMGAYMETFLLAAEIYRAAENEQIGSNN